MLSWGEHGGTEGNSMTGAINIHAKFGKTLVMNDHSPWLPLDHKYLQGRGILQNKVVNIIKGYRMDSF